MDLAICGHGRDNRCTSLARLGTWCTATQARLGESHGQPGSSGSVVCEQRLESRVRPQRGTGRDPVAVLEKDLVFVCEMGVAYICVWV